MAVRSPTFFAGVVAVFIVTGACTFVPWERLPRQLIAIIPLFDMGAISILRSGTPELGLGLLYVFPVIWLATYFGRAGAIGGPIVVAVLVWVNEVAWSLPLTENDIPSLVVLPMTIAFISMVVYLSGQRRTAQQALLRQQARLLESAFERARKQERTLEEELNSVPFGVVAFDRNGRITLVNNVHETMLVVFGRDHDHQAFPAIRADKNALSFLQDDANPYARALRGQSFDDQVVWVRWETTVRALAVSARQLTTTSGDHDGGVVVSRDVTAELAAVEARDGLVASVSHELRTPLTSILGFMELALDDETLRAQTRDRLDIALKNAERLLVLVGDILSAASDSDQVMVMEFATCDVESITRAAMQAQQVAAEQRGIGMTLQCEGSSIVRADPSRIRQVIDNLISNAIKYNRDHGSVSILLRERPEEFEFQVSDTGAGLTELEQARLFDKFYRSESARKSKVIGSGLGLNISREIMRKHGGDLTVASFPGVGTTFTAVLPKSST